MHSPVFLTPWALMSLPVIFAGVAVVWLTMLRARAQRARALGFDVSRRPSAAAVCATAAVILVALAAAQPALPGSSVARTRSDAQVWVTVDTSNSMLARRSMRAATRLTQARLFSTALRGRLSDLPVGIAVMTDRVLPLLPPTSDPSIFATVVKHTVQPDTPPPHSDFRGRLATSLSLLEQVPQQDFFAHASRRVMVLITDGETQSFDAAAVSARFHAQHEQLIVVRAGTSHDQIWLNGHVDSVYAARRQVPPSVAQLVRLEGEPLYTTGQASAVAHAVRAAVGSGPMMVDGRRPVFRSLVLYLLLAALPLLVFTLAVYLGGAFTAGRRSRLA